MYLMYVDESGDVGTLNSPTRHFILTGIIFHELRWKTHLEDLVVFRKHLRDTKGLKLREEIHSTDLINKPGDLVRIKRHERLDIIKQCVNWASTRQDFNVITVCIDKTANLGNDIFELAWKLLIQRFENTISHSNFLGPKNTDERGMILADNTEGERLVKLIRRLRHYNMVPSKYGYAARNLKLQYVIEDPIFRDSQSSYFHQICDVVAYCARQKYAPNKYMKSKGGHRLYERLLPVIVRMAAPNHPLGIIER